MHKDKKMTRTILIINSKGGSGKTTIATNIASYFSNEGKSVALIDLDPQQSSADWVKARSSAKKPIGIYNALNYGKIKRNTDVKVFDAPAGITGKDLTKVLTLAQSVIVPVLPSPIDMKAASKFIEALKKHPRIVNKKAKIALVANKGRDFTNIYWELDDFLSKQKIPFLTMIRDSQNYIKAASRGVGIFEMGPAMTDIDRELWEPVIKWLKSKRSMP